MKCPNCGNELEEGKLLCEHCGEEVKIVPDFDIELEDKLKESISDMLQDMAAEELNQNDFHQEPKNKSEDTINDPSAYFLTESSSVRKLRIVIIVLMLMILAAVIVVFTIHSVNDQRYHSFDYQYNKAVTCAAESDYPSAISYLERALAIRPKDLDVRLLLAEYNEKNGQQQKTIALLEEILDMGTEYSKREEVYDRLLKLYASEEAYAEMDRLLKQCDMPRILFQYNKYVALKPQFNKQGGVYNESLSISLKGNAPGIVYYTLDGTLPTTESIVYDSPILLESGDYVIKAMFVNAYGIESETVTQHYVINQSAPDSPVVRPESGTYTEPVLIAAFYDAGTSVYYTTDGSVPDKNSIRYRDPIEMPYGISNFAFIAYDASGLCSKVVNRSYQLGIQANFDAELALQVLKNSLWASGKLLDADGNLLNKQGRNQYKIKTLYKTDETMYYIVYEVYVDISENVHETNEIYAIDVNTADLFKAYKADEGVYHLQPLE